MKSLPLYKGLSDFFPAKIIEETDVTYVIYQHITGFVLILKISNDGTYYYANGGSDLGEAIENYNTFTYYNSITELLK